MIDCDDSESDVGGKIVQGFQKLAFHFLGAINLSGLVGSAPQWGFKVSISIPNVHEPHAMQRTCNSMPTDKLHLKSPKLTESNICIL